MNDWLLAVLAIVVAVVVGLFVSRIIRGVLGKETRPELMQQNAAAIGSIVFSLLLVVGLITALGFVKPAALDKITDDAVAYLPKALSAGIVVILGNILATIASTAALQAVARSGERAAQTIPTVVKAAIMGFTVILAASQLGIDTTTLNIAVAALLFSIGLSLAMLVGLGGRQVSGEIAAGRALRRMLEPGDEINSDALDGTVITVHSTAVEVETSDGSILVPNSQIVGSTMSITRPEPQQAPA